MRWGGWLVLLVAFLMHSDGRARLDMRWLIGPMRAPAVSAAPDLDPGSG